MQPNLLDVMKARSGIPTNDLFAMLWAQKLRAGSSRVQTLTGIPPLTFKANGKPLISWSMKGNGQQTGTPTPDNPVMPEFVGKRTAQLFEGSFGGSIGATGGISSSEQYEVHYARVTAGATYTISGGYYVYAYYRDIPSTGTSKSVDNTRHYTSQGNTITAIEGATWIGVRVNAGDKPMLNSGSTALPYEPFGYKIPIPCAGQTVPVYLGQVNTVRRIRKLVLTGEEANWYYYENATSTVKFFYLVVYRTVGVNLNNLLNTHGFNMAEVTQQSGNILIRVYAVSEGMGTLEEWKAYLAAQYSAGTPVCVWYALAEPETAIVNEPLAKIGDYADELHSADAGVSIPTVKGQNTLTVETDLQPSEMTITFKS